MVGSPDRRHRRGWGAAASCAQFPRPGADRGRLVVNRIGVVGTRLLSGCLAEPAPARSPYVGSDLRDCRLRLPAFGPGVPVTSALAAHGAQ